MILDDSDIQALLQPKLKSNLLGTVPKRASSYTEVLGVLQEIIEKVGDQACIFRGEPREYEASGSSIIYRYYSKTHIDKEPVSREVFLDELHHYQKASVSEARKYVSYQRDIDVLMALRIQGGRTNLIDFSINYLVALFFACQSNFDHDGYLIIKRQSDFKGSEQGLHTLGLVPVRENVLIIPPVDNNRVQTQHNAFVYVPYGRLDLNPITEVVLIRRDYKPKILEYLHKLCNIVSETLFNDLHGYVSNQSRLAEAEVYFTRALAATDKGDYDVAIEHYTKALQVDPNFASAYTMRGVAYTEKGDSDKAIEDYSKAIEINPYFIDAYINRGNVYLSRGDLYRAIQDYDQALDLNPQYAEAYCNRGSARFQKMELELAIADYDKAIKLNPRLAEAYNSRGNVYYEQGDLDRAMEDYNQALEVNPKLAETYYNRADAYMKKSDWE